MVYQRKKLLGILISLLFVNAKYDQFENSVTYIIITGLPINIISYNINILIFYCIFHI